MQLCIVRVREQEQEEEEEEEEEENTPIADKIRFRATDLEELSPCSFEVTDEMNC